MKKLLHDFIRILSAEFIVVLAILLVLAGLVSLGYVYRKPLIITYHKVGLRSAQKAMQRSATPKLQRESFERHSGRVGRHMKALVRLGYLEERSFQTEFLTAGSPQIQAMTEDFSRRYPHASCSFSWGKEFTVTDRPERMPTWESLIRKYDVPPIDSDQPAASENLPKAEALWPCR
jgi:hypothetical protein